MRKLKSLDRRMLTILAVVFVQMVGASMAQPILPLYAQQQFAMSPEIITMMLASYFVAQFLAGPTIGRLSDRHGRIPVLVISQLGTVVSFIMLGLAQGVPMLFLARILDGITGGNIIVARAYIIDITPRERRTQALGYMFAGFGLGYILGPAIGGMLAAALGIRMPFMVAAGATLLVVLMTQFWLDETVSPEQRVINRNFKKASLRPAEIISNTPLVMILTITFVAQFGLGLLQATFALLSGDVLFAGSSEQATNLGVGLLFAMIGIGQVITQIFILPRLIKRFEDGKLVILGAGLRVLSMTSIGAAASPLAAAPAVSLFAVGGGVMNPPLQSLVTETVADELRGGVIGLHQSAISLSTIFSTALGGVLYAITPGTPYFVGAALYVVSTGLAVVLLRWSHAHHPPADALALGPAK